MLDLGPKAGSSKSGAPHGKKRVLFALECSTLIRILGEDETRRNIECEAQLPDPKRLPLLGLKRGGAKKKSKYTERNPHRLDLAPLHRASRSVGGPPAHHLVIHRRAAAAFGPLSRRTNLAWRKCVAGLCGKLPWTRNRRCGTPAAKLTPSLNRPPFRPERKNWGAGLLQEKLGVYVPFFGCDALLASQLLEGFAQLIEVER